MTVGTLISPVAGIVSAVEKAIGDAVDVDDPVIVVECMKMLIPVAATAAGRIKEIMVAEGDALEEGQVVCLLEA
ncbi:MAG TPA: biotin/lipoyl-containing protein [Rhizomicrobium sp.]